ncbi:hypothetical protein [uncultured Ruminococcus sp.]|uniref:hypothetical protein n=1 Tax=uncultured Ruminococcus sp. TaxID=165186 RepID=UPI0025D2D10A|nr:hypothetical protein [uncultured Ruminococcus sp.]
MADEFVVNDAVFIKVDTAKLGEFIDKSDKMVEDFEKLKERFKSINETILKSWEGEGADEYKYETDHILEKIGDLKAVLDQINNSTVKDIRQQFCDADAKLAESNREMANDDGSEE